MRRCACLRGSHLRHAAHGLGCQLLVVLRRDFRLGCLDIRGVVRSCAGRVITGLLEPYEIGAHLCAGQWARCGLCEAQRGTVSPSVKDRAGEATVGVTKSA
jgi:hypothetical protein